MKYQILFSLTPLGPVLVSSLFGADIDGVDADVEMVDVDADVDMAGVDADIDMVDVDADVEMADADADMVDARSN